MTRNKLLGSAAFLGAIMVGATAMAADLTIVSWGGSYQDAQSKAIFEPVAEKMGISIAQDSYGGISDVRLQVQAGAVTWDIIDTGSGGGARGGVEGILEPLDYEMIDVSNFVPGTYIDHCVGTITFSTVFAYNTEKYTDEVPKTWADFWDVEKFPGERSYRGKYSGALEPALIADGVAPADVYKVLDSEEGIKRAVDKIRELKPHIAVWWQSGAQHAQLIKDGEVDMASGWNGRFDVAIADGAKAAYNYDGALLDYDCFGIPKGAPNKELAMKFLAEASKASYQAAMPQYITYGPTNKEAYDLGTIPPDLAKKLPSYPANAEQQLVLNNDWYAKWEKVASEMYQEMITE
ncbi:polyamine ABC transporter substrate-binding protein [Rhodobacteraceae bacterium NNCM2]|nr:polyamine ABC transporter substrate-binding protein [Coraliihabitans acroporae]